jgi:hypothetical protein
MAKKKRKVNHDIKNNFEHYSRLVIDRKTTKSGNLYLEVKKSNVDWKYADTNTIHKTLSDTISFYVESKIDNNQDFKFGLMSKDLTEQPFFRFDSDGAAHHNRDEDLALEMVLTPHFQKYSKNGISIAYQTEQLKSKTTCETLKKDINLCMAHFCHESNTRYLDDDFPQVDMSYDRLNLIFPDEEDPLKGLFTNNE